MPKQFVVSNPLPSKIEDTPNGVAVTLRLYMYPRGHGYVAHSEPDHEGRVISVPAASPAHLLGILAMLVHEMWRKAERKAKRNDNSGA